MFIICGTHRADGCICVTFEDSKLSGNDALTQFALDTDLANKGAFPLHY